MEMQSPFSLCSQLCSQGRVQTLPQTAGKGFFSRITSTASSNLLFAIRLTYAFTLIPAGHAIEHSGASFASIIYSSSSPVRMPCFPPMIDSVSKYVLFCLVSFLKLSIGAFFFCNACLPNQQYGNSLKIMFLAGVYYLICTSFIG